MEIQLNKIVEREVCLRKASAVDKNSRSVEFTLSTESPDTFNTVFKLSSWNLERYAKNPLVLYGHKTNSDNPDLIVGSSEVRIEGDALIGIVTFEDADINPLAEKVLRKIQAGTLRMASINAVVKKGHWGDEKLGENRKLMYFDEVELLEWSIVPIGSNPDALKREAQTIYDLSMQRAAEVRKETRTMREVQLIINKNKSKK